MAVKGKYKNASEVYDQLVKYEEARPILVEVMNNLIASSPDVYWGLVTVVGALDEEVEELEKWIISETYEDLETWLLNIL